jgi:DHA1 family bicyclomycin/chloramphenicol resistance-like MFS transporter
LPVLRANTFALTALLAALTGIGPLSTDMYLPSLPDIANRLDATTAQTQLTISAYLVGFAIGQLLYGPASDRFGRKPVLMAGLLIYCAASLLCGFASSIEMLMLARALQAVGACSGIVLARAIVRDLYSGARAGRELSLMGMVMALAPVLAPVAGGVLQTLFGWRANFVVLTASGLLIVLAMWLLLPETLQRRSPALNLTGMLRSFGGFLCDGNFLAHTGLVVFVFAGLFAWISGSSFVLQNIYGQSAFDFGLAFAIGSVGYMGGSALAAKFVGRYGIGTVSGFGAGAAAAGGLLMAGAVALGIRSGFALVLPMALYLAGMGGVLGQAIAGAMQPYHDRAGAASSLLGFIQQSLSAVVGVVIGHMLGDSAMPMAAGVAVCGCITLAIWVTTRGTRARGLRR